MRSTRRLALVLCLGLFFSGTGAVWLHHEEQAAAVPDDPGLRGFVPETTTTTVPPTTVATVPVPVTAAPAARTPARVPSNPYANEPMIELGTIEIPKIGLNHRIFQGISLRSIDRGPSHWPGTALPGEVGNSVFAGHRVTHSKPFRNIDQLAPGDEVIFNVNGNRSVYTVTGSEVVTPKALHIVDQTPTPTATLFACHPPGSARFRYVVHLALKT
ncbi:MAG TPA: class E sortase [Acidimicrobiales bacterium]|jgi:sortase A|nr:class E sortase [Acidimicrobiales bacterium]